MSAFCENTMCFLNILCFEYFAIGSMLRYMKTLSQNALFLTSRTRNSNSIFRKRQCRSSLILHPVSWARLVGIFCLSVLYRLIMSRVIYISFSECI